MDTIKSFRLRPALWRAFIATAVLVSFFIAVLQINAQTDATSSDACIQVIDGSGMFDRSWDDTCLSEKDAPGGTGDRYARFFTFTLSSAGTVTATLTSEQDTYLYLLEGNGKNGTIEDENDDVIPGSDTNSSIPVNSLEAGDYTIEATTYDPATSGDFTLVVEITGTTATPPDSTPETTPTTQPTPDPSPEPSPEPTPDPTPEPPPATPPAVETMPATFVSAGANHTCSLDHDGAIECRGMDDHEQVSDHPDADGFIAISVGANHSCALDEDGYAECWGSDEYGQSSPASGQFVAIGSGDSYSCALREGGDLHCWGQFEPVPTPTPEPTLTPEPISTPTPEPTPDPTPEPTPTNLGSRSNPIPLGQSFRPPDSQWELRIISVDWDAWPEIEAENRFNDPPASGNKFVMVKIAVHNRGSEPDSFGSSNISAVGSQAVEYRTFVDSCGVIPDDFSNFTRIFSGGELQGNICYEVASSDVNSLLLFGDRYTFDIADRDVETLWFWKLR